MEGHSIWIFDSRMFGSLQSQGAVETSMLSYAYNEEVDEVV
jgi:hypothetical protein